FCFDLPSRLHCSLPGTHAAPCLCCDLLVLRKRRPVDRVVLFSSRMVISVPAVHDYSALAVGGRRDVAQRAIRRPCLRAAVASSRCVPGYRRVAAENIGVTRYAVASLRPRWQRRLMILLVKI